MKDKIKVHWFVHELVFLRENVLSMTWNQLLSEINEMRDESDPVDIGALRHQCYRMGLKKRDLVHWSDEDITFLLENYKTIGNSEMARILTEKQSSSREINGKMVVRTFSKKHVEKKMQLLKIARTKDELSFIKKHNKEIGMGCFYTSENNAWTRGYRKSSPEGDVRIWRRTNGKKSRFIKVDGRFVPYAPWFYKTSIGPVPEGYIVYHLDNDILNDEPENLAICPRKGLNSSDRLNKAISLLSMRERTILHILPSISYDKNRDEIKRLHSDLNRIRRISEQIQAKLHKRSLLSAY